MTRLRWAVKLSLTMNYDRFWESAYQAAREVATWPAWKRLEGPGWGFTGGSTMTPEEQQEFLKATKDFGDIPLRRVEILSSEEVPSTQLERVRMGLEDDPYNPCPYTRRAVLRAEIRAAARDGLNWRFADVKRA